MSDAVEQLRLIRTEGVGPLTYKRLMARFAGVEAAMAALPDLARAGGRTTPFRLASRAEAEREMAQLQKLGGRFCFLGDPEYPPFLADTADAPPVLSVLGDINLLSARAVGVVGARNASANGMRMAEQLGADLARELVVVSGLARGIDASAHTGAMPAPIRGRCGPGGRLPQSPAGSMSPTRPSMKNCRRGSPRTARWWPRRRLAPRRWPGIFRSATG
jgi:DNA processing protein